MPISAISAPRRSVPHGVQFVRCREGRAGIRRLITDRPVVFGGVPDGFVDGQPQIGRIDHQIGGACDHGGGLHLLGQEHREQGEFLGPVPDVGAGKGSRLYPHTEDKPKCLLPLAGRTLLEWQLDALHAAVARHDSTAKAVASVRAVRTREVLRAAVADLSGLAGLDEVLDLSDRVYVMKDGAVVETGRVPAVVRRPH